MAIRHITTRIIQKFERKFEVYNQIEVSRSALLHNAQLISSQSQMAVMPVLKGNAYGHGTEIVAKALKDQNFPYIAVDGYFEAVQVRNVSRQPVLIMGAIRPENFANLHYDKFAFVVQHVETVKALAATGHTVKVHLEINTGMNRFGVRPNQVAELTKLILSYQNLELEGVMSHLADADGHEYDTVQMAVQLFDKAVETVCKYSGKPAWLHIAQTAGSATATSRYANAVRLGIGLYGINPFAETHTSHDALSSLLPALRLTSTIANTIELRKGEQVSYNYTFTAPKAMRIGIIPMGYYEGLNRNLSNQGVMKCGDTYLPIVGRICMNHTMLDLTASDAQIGDRVIVYSDITADRNSIERIGDEYELFNYNLLTALSGDVRRILVK